MLHSHLCRRLGRSDHAWWWRKRRLTTSETNPLDCIQWRGGSERSENLDAELAAVARALPRGGRFEYTVGETNVRLVLLEVPTAAPRGAGTRFLAEVLALTDLHAIGTLLDADPVDDIKAPGVFELVR
jgi:hypothetical protein